MNPLKLQKLFALARNEPAPNPPSGFAADILRVIRREERSPSLSLFDELGALFPRLAVAALVLIGLCVAADFGVSALGQPDLTAAAAQISDHWLFATKGF